jgi:hypothetical protein
MRHWCGSTKQRLLARYPPADDGILLLLAWSVGLKNVSKSALSRFERCTTSHTTLQLGEEGPPVNYVNP